ncbi:MAG: hypothetical protein ACYCYF_01070 [Anaerolineae bacterium]
MKVANSLRMLWLGIWMIVTGLLLVISGAMAAVARADEQAEAREA